MNTSNPTLSPDGGFEGGDFSNNLFTDLAPLLTLFGEQVTKQFLSQSLGWGDNILLAMAPLGILTCVISAIRVGGKKWLKALVGRARESVATAELELLSSTSDQVLRERGVPLTKEFIYRKVGSDNFEETPVVFDLHTACQADVYRPVSQKSVDRRVRSITEIPRLLRSLCKRLFGKSRKPLSLEEIQQLTSQAPNITLNITNAVPSTKETWLFALAGICVQAFVLVFAALVTYYWRWGAGQTSGQSTEPYGFPLFFTGSIALNIGIMLCSHIIEAVTDESRFEPAPNSEHLRVVRLQCACTVGEQRFKSFVIKNTLDSPVIRTSRRDLECDFSALAVVATTLAIGGYIVQFVGLRAMHWSVAITVLGATLLMTGIRSFVRKGLSADPDTELIEEGQELSWIALDAYSLKSLEIPTGFYSNNIRDMDRDLTQHEILSARIPDMSAYYHDNTGRRCADVVAKAVDARVALQKLVPWNDDTTKYAQQAADAITGIMNFVLLSQDLEDGQMEFKDIAPKVMRFEEEPGHAKSERDLVSFRLKDIEEIPDQDHSLGDEQDSPLKRDRRFAMSNYGASHDARVSKQGSASGSKGLKGDAGKVVNSTVNRPTVSSSSVAGSEKDIQKVLPRPRSNPELPSLDIDYKHVSHPEHTRQGIKSSSKSSSSPTSLDDTVEIIKEGTDNAIVEVLEESTDTDTDTVDSHLHEPVRRSEAGQDPRHYAKPSREKLRKAIKKADITRSPGLFISSLGDDDDDNFNQMYLRYEWDCDISIVQSNQRFGAVRNSKYRFFVDALSTPEDEISDAGSQNSRSKAILSPHKGSKMKLSVDVNIILAVISLIVHSIKPRDLQEETAQKPFLRLLGDYHKISVEPERRPARIHIETWASKIEDLLPESICESLEQFPASNDPTIPQKRVPGSTGNMAKSIRKSNSTDRKRSKQGDQTVHMNHGTVSAGQRVESPSPGPSHTADHQAKSNPSEGDEQQELIELEPENDGLARARYRTVVSASQRHAKFRGIEDRRRLSSIYDLWIERQTQSIVVPCPGLKHEFLKASDRKLFQLQPIFGMGVPSHNRGLSTFRSGQNQADPPPRQSAVPTKSPLPRLCAQEIFISFLLQLTELIAKIKGHTSQRFNHGDSTDVNRWSNTVLRRMAVILIRSGLVDDEEEAYMLIVPVFHARGILPTELTPENNGSSASYLSYTSSDSSSTPLDRRLRRESC